MRNSILILLVMFLSGCPLKDWIKSDDDQVSVDEFKRITQSLKGDGNKKAKLEQLKKYEEVTFLFKRLEDYKHASDIEKKVLLKKGERDFKQNPTLLDALFLSMIQVTIPRKRDSLAINSSYMKAVDISRAEPGLLELRNVFKSLDKISSEKIRLTKKLKKYQAENSQQKEIVKELTAQINALKNIEESIYERELFSSVQE
ncbi:MAG: hypothetical protein R3240_01780 [Gammaproteobacteria bacterium]|nr:hypothetical protein [Gammaproteobacteria bacterium]